MKCIELENVNRTYLYKQIKNDFATEPYVYKIRNKRNRSLFARLRAGYLDFQIDGEILSERPEYALYAIMESRMKFIFHFIVVDWSIYDCYIVILYSEIKIRVKMNVFLFFVPKIMV